VARYSGDEFTVLLPKLGLEEAIALAKTIQQAVHNLAIPRSRSTPREFITVSLGVASQFPTLGTVADSLVFHADQAMAKNQHQEVDCYSTNTKLKKG
jgi:diguanylate cyclase (GGDEF)-like protein